MHEHSNPNVNPAIQQPSYLAGLEVDGRPQNTTCDTAFPSNNPTIAQRAADLRANLPFHPERKSKIATVEPIQHTSSSSEDTEARSLLAIRRLRELDTNERSVAKRLSLTPTHKTWDENSWVYSAEDLDKALEEVVKESRSVGGARALLNKGADVNSIRHAPKKGFNIIRDKARVPTPVNHVKQAVLNSDTQMVTLLAQSGASASSKNEALAVAIRHERDEHEIVGTLLQSGANPNLAGESILETAVSMQKLASVELLLRAPAELPKEFLDAAPPVAVSSGQLEMTILLLIYGANVDYREAQALNEAIRLGRIDLTLILLGGNPSAQYASRAFQYAFSSSGTGNVEEKYDMIHILLESGAVGHHVNETLVEVTTRGHPYHSIGELLVRFRASARHKDGRALQIAVAKGDVSMLSILLRANPKDSDVSNALRYLPQTFQNSTYDIMSLLLLCGANGEPVDRALTRAVQQGAGNVVGLLLDNRACVDTDDARAIQISVLKGDLQILEALLMKGRPKPKSIEGISPLIPKSPSQLRFDLTRMLLTAHNPTQVSRSVLGIALSDAVGASLGVYEVKLATLLIRAGARRQCSWRNLFTACC